MCGIVLAGARTRLKRVGIFPISAMLLLGGMLVFSALTPTQEASASTTEADDLTGAWTVNDGGTYYLRQIGNEVWWAALSEDNGRTYSNVFHGTREGDLISGSWADVPRGRIMQNGSLTVSIVSTTRGIELVTKDQTGGFGGLTWYKGTPPQSSAPDDTLRTILEDGIVEIRYPDGTVRRYCVDGTLAFIGSDGKTYCRFSQTQPAKPPLDLLSAPNMRPWLESHNESLLNIIKSLLTAGEREKAINNLHRRERGMSLYSQVDFRTGALLNLRK